MKNLFKLLICLLTVVVTLAFTPSTADAQFTLPDPGTKYEGIMGSPYLVYIGTDAFWVYPLVEIPGGDKVPGGAFIDLGYTVYMMTTAGGVGLTGSDMFSCAGHQVILDCLGKFHFGIAVYVIAGLL